MRLAPFLRERAIRAGTSYELVARQLGHADAAMVAKVYGRFAPRSDERDRWEKIAAAQDQTCEKKSDVMGAVVGAIVKAPENDKAHKPLGSRALEIAGAGLESATPAL